MATPPLRMNEWIGTVRLLERQHGAQACQHFAEHRQPARRKIVGVIRRGQIPMGRIAVLDRHVSAAEWRENLSGACVWEHWNLPSLLMCILRHGRQLRSAKS